MLSIGTLLKSHQGTIWNQLEHRQCRMIPVLWEYPTTLLFSQIYSCLIGRKHGNLILRVFNFLYFQICPSSNQQKTQKLRKHDPATLGHTILKQITRRSSDGWSNLCGSRFQISKIGAKSGDFVSALFKQIPVVLYLWDIGLANTSNLDWMRSMQKIFTSNIKWTMNKLLINQFKGNRWDKSSWWMNQQRLDQNYAGPQILWQGSLSNWIKSFERKLSRQDTVICPKKPGAKGI